MDIKDESDCQRTFTSGLVYPRRRAKLRTMPRSMGEQALDRAQRNAGLNVKQTDQCGQIVSKSPIARHLIGEIGASNNPHFASPTVSAVKNMLDDFDRDNRDIDYLAASLGTAAAERATAIWTGLGYVIESASRLFASPEEIKLSLLPLPAFAFGPVGLNRRSFRAPRLGRSTEADLLFKSRDTLVLLGDTALKRSHCLTVSNNDRHQVAVSEIGQFRKIGCHTSITKDTSKRFTIQTEIVQRLSSYSRASLECLRTSPQEHP